MLTKVKLLGQKKIVFLIFTFFLGLKTGNGQNMQGYLIDGDTTVFVFDEDVYEIESVEKVAVTGPFRNWDQGMDDVDWLLTKDKDKTWTLKVSNPDLKKIPPHTEFKFRVNKGEWVQPPHAAPNKRSGNLVFLHNVLQPSFKAEILSNYSIWVKLEGVNRSLDPQDYVLTNAVGERIKISSVLPNTASEMLLTPEEAIDKRRIYFLEIPDERMKTWCSFDGWFRSLYSNKELGANITDDGKATIFRIFSPRAELVKLYLYKNSDDTKAYDEIEMVADENMVWETIVDANLKGIFYDFTVHGSKDPGNHFYESLPKHISDPYARVNMDAWGKSMVWERTKPATPLKNGIPLMEDVIAYEVHVQDFTDLLPVSKDEKGTFPAMHKSGLVNKNGHKIGFDYLKDLGINTLHLMPVQEFMHHPDEIWESSFKDDPFMVRHGIAHENYQWGYRTSHCFAVENKFRSRNTKPGEERNQFRDLVQSYHDAGIAVIIDIVPNHTAEDMDGNWFFHFNVLDKLYYYRTKDLDHIGEYGNEVKTENRPMVQKWLIDQCLHFINEFGIDGFRIDLAGQIDKQTLIKLKDAIGHDKILYGEPWIASNDPAFEENPDWDWYKADAPITFFQDDARNAFKGPTDNPRNPYKDRGYAGGNTSERNKVLKGLANTFPDDHTTVDGINYLDIHDNWALADQFALHNWDGRKGVDEDALKIAATLLFTSLGPIVMHGGTEHLRSKGEATLKETVKTLKNGVNLYFHGKRDTYNMRKPNQFKWEHIGMHKTADNPVEYKGMYDFWKGLIALRNSDLGKIFRKNMTTPPGYYKFILPEDHSLLGYIIDRKLFVAINVSESSKILPDVELPEGNWVPIGNNTKINHKGISETEHIEVNKGNVFVLSMGPKSLLIWKKEE